MHVALAPDVSVAAEGGAVDVNVEGGDLVVPGVVSPEGPSSGGGGFLGMGRLFGSGSKKHVREREEGSKESNDCFCVCGCRDMYFLLVSSAERLATAVRLFFFFVAPYDGAACTYLFASRMRCVLCRRVLFVLWAGFYVKT